MHANITNQILQALLTADETAQASALRVLRGEKPAPSGPHFLTGPGAARLLGVSPKTLRRWLKIAGVTTVEVLPGRFRYRREDIENIAQKAAYSPCPAPHIRPPRRTPAPPAAIPQLPQPEEQTQQPKENQPWPC